MSSNLLKIHNLKIKIGQNKKIGSINFSIDKNEIIAIQGPSGIGKSLLLLSIIGLLPKGINLVDGVIQFNGEKLNEKKSHEMKKILQSKIATIFQDSNSGLNPSMKIWDQIYESAKIKFCTNDDVIKSIGIADKNKITEEINNLLISLGFENPSEILNLYPHELSGGMKQRIMIAIAIVRDCELLIADEITSALDVMTAKKVLTDIRSNLKGNKKSAIFISHDQKMCEFFADKTVHFSELLS